MYKEDELLPLSGLQHLAFCARQCALIHVEQAWSENRFTAEGRVMHEHVHEQGHESRGEVRIERGVRLRSLRLGIIGQADVVEFHKRGEKWQPFPVEYKRGKPKANRCDDIQLCAQAMCLEEMLEVSIPAGALFYGRTRRRSEVEFDDELRAMVEEQADAFHKLVTDGHIPPAVNDKRCKSCSLAELCMPKITAGGLSVQNYLRAALLKAEPSEMDA